MYVLGRYVFHDSVDSVDSVDSFHSAHSAHSFTHLIVHINLYQINDSRMDKRPLKCT